MQFRLDVYHHVDVVQDLTPVLQAVERIEKTMSKITDSTDKTLAELDKANASLDKISADEANLHKLIQDLKDQLASGTLSAEDQAALDKVVAASEALSAKAKTVDDAEPEPPVTV